MNSESTPEDLEFRMARMMINECSHDDLERLFNKVNSILSGQSVANCFMIMGLLLAKAARLSPLGEKVVLDAFSITVEFILESDEFIGKRAIEQ